MCGISGIISNSDISLIHLKNKFNEILSHRGPDGNGSGSRDNNKICLFHTRLAIQDLSFNGKQPMSSKSKRFIISFNGEIYNHLKLRKILPNIKWTGSSDTETLVELIDCFGIEKALDKIQGMFAFALYDKKEEKNIFSKR